MSEYRPLERVYSPILYRPPTPTYPRSQVKFINNQIAYEWIPYPSSNITILYSHGIGSDLGKVKNSMTSLAQSLKSNLIIWDYPGYGYSQGHPSESSIFKAAEFVYAYLKTEHPSDKIILFGSSLGSGVSCYLAAKLSLENLPYAGVILQASFFSGASLFLPENTVLSVKNLDIYRNYQYILHIEKPIFMIHGGQDNIIPLENSLKLAQQAPNLWKFLEIKNAGHMDLRKVGGDIYQKNMEMFIDYLRFL